MSKVQKYVQEPKMRKAKKQGLTRYVKEKKLSRIRFTARKFKKNIRSKNIFEKLKSCHAEESTDNPLEGGDFNIMQKRATCDRDEKKPLVLLEPTHEEHFDNLEMNHEATSSQIALPAVDPIENVLKTAPSTSLAPFSASKNDDSESLETSIDVLLHQNLSTEDTLDSIIHVVEPDDDEYELDDEDELLDQPQRSSISHPHTKTTHHYQTALHTPYEGGDNSESENEESDSDNESKGSIEGGENLYIDSGLRLLRPTESKLFLDKPERTYRKHTSITKAEVQPLLSEIPASVFRMRELRKKMSRQNSNEVISQTSSFLEEPEEDKDKSGFSTTTVASHPSGLIDTRPLLKFGTEDGKEEQGDYSKARITSQPSGLIDPRPLLEFGEYGKPKGDSKRKFTIRKFWKKKEDICVHTKDVPGSSQDFSSSSVKDKKKRSIFRFFRKRDFCVHTVEPENDATSVGSSGVFRFFRKSNNSVRAPSENSRVFDTDRESKIFGSKAVSEEHRVRHLAPIEETGRAAETYKSRTPSRSLSGSNMWQHSRQKSILLPSNKERRRSKFQKIQNRDSDDASYNSSFSISSRIRKTGMYSFSM